MAAAAARWARSCEWAGRIVVGYMGPQLAGVAVPLADGIGLVRAQLCARACARTDFCGLDLHAARRPRKQHLTESLGMS